MTRSARLPFLSLLSLIAVGVLGTSERAYAQSELAITTGSVIIPASESMGMSGPALNVVHVGYSRDVVGVTLGYNSGYWPWPKPPGSGPGGEEDACLDPPGGSLTVGLETYPLRLLERIWGSGGTPQVLATISDVVRPFVGLGVLHTDDWIPGGHTHYDTVGEATDNRSQSALVTSYGTSILIPTMVRNVGMQVQYHRSERLAGSMGRPLTDGGVASQPASSWSQWQVGFRININ
jgi:hypothetical protein